MALSHSTICQFGKESAWGTAVAADKLLPYTTFRADPDIDEELDEAHRGDTSMDRASYQGMGRATIEVEGPFYPSLEPYFLEAILGSLATSGASAPYTHDAKEAATVTSFTFEDKDPVQARKYTGAQVSRYSVRFAKGQGGQGLLTRSMTLTSKLPSDVAAASVADATDAPIRGWGSTLTVGGSDLAALISGEWTIERAQEPSPHANNSQDMARLDPGRVRFTGSMVWDAAADHLDKYIANTQEAIQIVSTYGAGAALKELKILSTLSSYMREPMRRDLSSVAKRMSVAYRGLFNATDDGVVNMIVKNAVSSY